MVVVLAPALASATASPAGPWHAGGQLVNMGAWGQYDNIVFCTFSFVRGFRQPWRALGYPVMFDSGSNVRSIAYQALGNGDLTTVLEPPAAIAEGARWTVDDGSRWYDSGATFTRYHDGYTVLAKDVPGWVTPASVGATPSTPATQAKLVYHRKGNLQAFLTPVPGLPSTARWSVDGDSTPHASGESASQPPRSADAAHTTCAVAPVVAGQPVTATLALVDSQANPTSPALGDLSGSVTASPYTVTVTPGAATADRTTVRYRGTAISPTPSRCRLRRARPTPRGPPPAPQPIRWWASRWRSRWRCSTATDTPAAGRRSPSTSALRPTSS